MLFADIAGFTAFAETLLPYDVIHVLRRYFHMAGDIIRRHHGYIDTYIGDGLMALFGVDEPDDAAFLAVNAALEIQTQMGAFNAYMQSWHHRELRVRIGIHCGPVVVGDIGVSGREHVTAIGDTVNLASRIEAANKAAGTSCLMSEAVYEQVRTRVRARPLLPVTLPGKSGEYALFELTGLAEMDSRP